ncbi:hypothetical protein AB0H73_09935 [Streptomyces olivoreticuli]
MSTVFRGLRTSISALRTEFTARDQCNQEADQCDTLTGFLDQLEPRVCRPVPSQTSGPTVEDVTTAILADPTIARAARRCPEAAREHLTQQPNTAARPGPGVAAFLGRAGLVDPDMDVIALARAGSRLEHANQLLTHVRDRPAGPDRRSASGSEAATVLGSVHQSIVQARDEALVAYALATVTTGPKAEARERALAAYSVLADLADGFDGTIEAFQDAGADASVLSRACQALGQAVVQLAHGISDEDLAAGGDGRTPVRLAVQFTVHAEAAAVPATQR